MAVSTGGTTGGRLVHHFRDGNASMRDLLGGKGANLAEMTRIGLPVPPGFTITTEACDLYYKAGKRLPEGLRDGVREALTLVEEETGKVFGGGSNPLLVSVRSGAVISMPGMMDTVLNLGLNDETVKALEREAEDRRFALDCYRRFIQMFGDVVRGIPHGEFERILERYKRRQGAEFDYEISGESLDSIISDYKELYKNSTGSDFPQDPFEQLLMAVEAVFASWNNERAIIYRNAHEIPHDLGTAVNVQTMVFGNLGPSSGTGVIFTRDPSTGTPEPYGEYLVNAQGEDVVAGIRTPRPIAEMRTEMPKSYDEIADVCQLLEDHYGDMQDIEFTIENGKLYVLQTRTGKRTAAAAVRIAVDFVREGKTDKAGAIGMVDPNQLEKLLHRTIDPKAQVAVLAKGLPASPGAASGLVVFDSQEAKRLGEAGETVLLVRPETTPEDIGGIVSAMGVLTSRGGMTCHAAIVARGMGKPCVVGCDALSIDMDREVLGVGGVTLTAGEWLTIDGADGRVIKGQVPMVDPELSADFQALLQWADDVRDIGVRANADNPTDAQKAREFGASGIGLCRTEHMFMEEDRLPVVREMILSATETERRGALDRLLPMQQGDFEGILEAMEGLPVTIRLLDPPLHEFLPDAAEILAEVSKLRATGASGRLLQEKEELLNKVNALEETNPMLGFRGCRLGIVYPEIYEMQARAIFQATANLVARGVDAQPEVMIPLVGAVTELAPLKEMVVRVAEEVKAESGVVFEYLVGTMIEVPRACLTAEEIAREAQFFSFGTNDLTQMTFGFSRDDAEGKFLHHYLHKDILEVNPFEVLDASGVGRLVELAVAGGRQARPDLKIGICGEHGGEPRSIAFCLEAGLDYVSCSPYRVPVARLAAAQATLKRGT